MVYFATVYKKTARTSASGRKQKAAENVNGYEARTARRAATATAATTAAFGFVTFARAVARAMFFALTTKHFSSDASTRASISFAFWRITSEISEMMRALARSSIRFSRNERLFDLLRKVRLLSTSAMS